MHRAHLQLVVLAEPLLVAPPFLQTPIQITAQLAGRGHRGLRLALGSKQALILFSHRTRRQFQVLDNLDQDPFEPGTTRAPNAPMGRLPSRALGARHEPGIRGESASLRASIGSVFARACQINLTW